MPIRPITVTQAISFLSVIALGLSGLQAFEQGSYIILDIVEKKAEDPTQISRLQIESSYFKSSEAPQASTTEVGEVSSEFLTELEQRSSSVVPSTLVASNFGDVDVAPETSVFETSTTTHNESTFGTDTTSVFGQ
ncbi:MAG: hypothetical protein ACN4GF_03140 [Lentimonas sp.]